MAVAQVEMSGTAARSLAAAFLNHPHVCCVDHDSSVSVRTSCFFVSICCVPKGGRQAVALVSNFPSVFLCGFFVLCVSGQRHRVFLQCSKE